MKNPKRYAFPALANKYGDYGLFRVSGVGLGNLLFPWARSILAARDHGLTPIWPTWVQFNAARHLDLFLEYIQRHYIGLFRRPEDYVGGVRKISLMLQAPKVPEDVLRGGQAPPPGAMVIFEGMETLFADLLQEHAFVKRELLRIMHPQHHAVLSQDFTESITINVRLGDFRVPSDLSLLEQGIGNYRLPMRWYVDQVTALRQALGRDYRVFVVSDGSEEQLAELLSLDNATYLGFGSAIADLIAISKANLLVASGSTYSMWGSYLGRMPVIWYRGQRKQRLYYENPDLEVEVRLDEELPSTFLHGAQAWVRSRAGQG